ncbi:MAG: GNAT family N-acetyltransferase [Nocardioidaceae bacterium]
MRFPDDVPTLTSGDVILRAHRLEDVDSIVEQCTDPVSVRWTTVPLGYTSDMAEQWVTKAIPESWETGQEYLFAIEATHHDGRRRFGGSLSLRDEGDRRAELAFGAHPGVRGQGVMTTAVNLLLDWGFQDRELETVLWLANVGNVASRRVAWRTGFTFGGTMRRWLVHRGDYLDGWVAALHRDDPRTPTTRWLANPRLATENLLLRPFTDNDAPGIAEACGDPRTQHWLAFMPNPYTEADALSWLASAAERVSTGEGVWWAVVDPADGQLLANVGLPRIRRDEGEVGYWAHPAARGRGVVSEAAAAVVEHAFTPEAAGGLGLRRLTLHAAAENAASRRVAEVNGFRENGLDRQAERLGDGTFTDLVRHELLVGEWRST